MDNNNSNQGSTGPTPTINPTLPTGNPGKKNQGNNNATLRTLKQLGQTNVAKVDSDIHALTIVGQIEGHMVLSPKNKTTKYEHLIPQLVAIEQNPNIKGVITILNTVGGDIEAGLAISEMMASLSKPTVSLVLGGGHSIGVPIAVATDYSFIAETATMIVHPIRLTGMVIGVPQTYEYLDKMQERIVNFVSYHSSINEKRFKKIMFETGELVRDVGTVLIGQDAVTEGIIDEVGGLGQAIKKLRQLINEEESKAEALKKKDKHQSKTKARQRVIEALEGDRS